jgi:hypothetical protein
MPAPDKPAFDFSEVHRVGGRGAIVGQPRAMSKRDADLVAAFLAKNPITRPTEQDEARARKERAKLERSGVIAHADGESHTHHSKQLGTNSGDDGGY